MNQFSAEVKASDGSGVLVWSGIKTNTITSLVVKQEDGRLKAGFEGRLVSHKIPFCN